MRGRHLLGLEGMTAEENRAVLGRADAYMNGADPTGVLTGRCVAMLFAEDSTRTRGSFTHAARRLGAEVIDFSTGTSISKGETLADTARTLEAVGADAIVVRTKQAGAPALVAGAIDGSVINAGDGRHEHPTQGLLDALAFARSTDRTDTFDFTGVTLAVVGDVASSRVARSDAAAFRALGAEVVFVGPPALAPRSLECLGARVERDLDAVLGRADAVQMLRVQFERHGGRGVPTRRAYRARYGLTEERAALMKPGAVVMHPGPMNRGLEIDDRVADGKGDGRMPRAIVLDQVACGVGVRMAVLATLLAPTSCSAVGEVMA